MKPERTFLPSSHNKQKNKGRKYFSGESHRQFCSFPMEPNEGKRAGLRAENM